MFIMDLPPEPINEVPVLIAQVNGCVGLKCRGARPDAVLPQQAPIVLVQADTSGAGTTPQPDYILKYCKETVSIGNPRSAMRAVDPAGMLAVYLERYKGAQYIDLAEIKNIALLEDTTHGKITSVIDNTGRPWYRYDAEPGYVGADRAVFMVEYQGVRYKIVVDMKVFIVVDENFPQCPPPKLIKVKKPSTGSSGYDMGSVSVSFANLDGGAIGQAVGTTITIDTNAASHNWYIDPTPGTTANTSPHGQGCSTINKIGV